MKMRSKLPMVEKVSHWRENELLFKILVILGWTLSLTSVVFLNWKIFYDAPKYQALMWFHSPGEGPSLRGYSLLLMSSISLVFGALVDIRGLTWGFLISQILLLITGSLCAFCYNWFIRGVCEDPLFASTPYAWEFVFFLALADIFRMIFPIAAVYCLIGALFGNLLRNWLKIGE